MKDTLSVGAARGIALDLASENFPEGEYTVVIHEWCDGDFKVIAQYGCGTTDAENSVREEYEVTPFDVSYRVVEVTESEEILTLTEWGEEDLGDLRVGYE